MSASRLGRTVSLIGALVVLAAACAPGDGGEPAAGASARSTRTAAPRTSDNAQQDGLIILSLEESGHAHLFAQLPGTSIRTRLSHGPWSDTSPAISPDGTQIAFASNRGGYWDLHLLALANGTVRQLTFSPEFDSAPSWSPDGQWLAFETYLDDNLEIAILSIADLDASFVRLTEDRSADHSPAWAPDGRRIAYVSTRGGESDIWMADLDSVGGDRFKNLSNNPLAAESFPAWSADGKRLAWAAASQAVGYSGVYLLDAIDESRPARWIGDGVRVSWGPDEETLVALLGSPNQDYLTSFDSEGRILGGAQQMPGRVRGLAAGRAGLPDVLPQPLAAAAAQTQAPGWVPAVTPAADVPAERWYLVGLPGVEAPYPQLHDLVDESFTALRRRLVTESGWDVLASLENAYVPLSAALDPGLQQDWLYTGRAFSINSLMATVGWMTVVREDFGAQTYWRVYVRCTIQDGSLGAPIHASPWDLNARYDLEPIAYEQGGRFAAVPSGYWVDVTALAGAYGWQRLPALPNWRSYFAGTRFSEFAMTSGLDWYGAMLELYPADALVTPTRVLPPTSTPTRTPRPIPSPGATRTPRPTATPTSTRTPTKTPSPSSTPPTIIP